MENKCFEKKVQLHRHWRTYYKPIIYIYIYIMIHNIIFQIMKYNHSHTKFIFITVWAHIVQVNLIPMLIFCMTSVTPISSIHPSPILCVTLVLLACIDNSFTGASPSLRCKRIHASTSTVFPNPISSAKIPPRPSGGCRGLSFTKLREESLKQPYCRLL